VSKRAEDGGDVGVSARKAAPVSRPRPRSRRPVDRIPLAPSYSPAVNDWLSYLADRLAVEFVREHCESVPA